MFQGRLLLNTEILARFQTAGLGVVALIISNQNVPFTALLISNTLTDKLIGIQRGLTLGRLYLFMIYQVKLLSSFPLKLP